eukprot:snap_masked-scaffold_7-processed-gene-1.10-mRNA-1 protein AED:1.00 eAED:1.00 QI:0/-1/0/0/-1/1/1/0/515
MKNLTNFNVKTFFEIESIGKVIEQNEFKRVGIQIPDKYLKYSHEVVQWLRQDIEVRKVAADIVVLGDTSFGASGDDLGKVLSTERSNCCIDEITAMHYHCDLVVHIGFHCFSRSSRVASLVVPSKSPLNICGLPEKLLTLYEFLKGCYICEKNRTIPMLCDVRFYSAAKELVGMVDKEGTKFIIPKFKSFFYASNKSDHLSLDNDIQGQIISLDELSFFENNHTSEERSIKIVFYIGKDEINISRLLLLLSDSEYLIFALNPDTASITVHCNIIKLEEELRQSVDFPLLYPHRCYKRLIGSCYGKISKIKDSLEKDKPTFGLVIGTLSSENYIQTLQKLRDTLMELGLPYYTFFVGKLTPQKLANFPNVDFFVLLSCPYNSFIQTTIQSSYHKPLVTLVELEIALGLKEWTGSIDFEDHTYEIKPIVEKQETSTSNQTKHLSLQYETETKQLVHIDQSSRQLGRAFESSAASFLQTMTFQGMDYNANVEPKSAEIGQTGIASSLTYIDDETKTKV